MHDELILGHKCFNNIVPFLRYGYAFKENKFIATGLYLKENTLPKNVYYKSISEVTKEFIDFVLKKSKKIKFSNYDKSIDFLIERTRIEIAQKTIRGTGNTILCNQINYFNFKDSNIKNVIVCNELQNKVILTYVGDSEKYSDAGCHFYKQNDNYLLITDTLSLDYYVVMEGT